jgi:hypothetical protein
MDRMPIASDFPLSRRPPTGHDPVRKSLDDRRVDLVTDRRPSKEGGRRFGTR